MLWLASNWKWVYRTAWLVSFLLNNPVIDSNPDKASNVYDQRQEWELWKLWYYPIRPLERRQWFEESPLAPVRQYQAQEDQVEPYPLVRKRRRFTVMCNSLANNRRLGGCNNNNPCIKSKVDNNNSVFCSFVPLDINRSRQTSSRWQTYHQQKENISKTIPFKAIL